MYNEGIWLPKEANPGTAWLAIIKDMETVTSRRCLFYYEVGESPQYYYWYGVSTNYQPVGGGIATPQPTERRP